MLGSVDVFAGTLPWPVTVSLSLLMSGELPPPAASCGLESLPGIGSQVARVQRVIGQLDSGAAPTDEAARALRIGTQEDLARVLRAVLGELLQPWPAEVTTGGAVGTPSDTRLPCDEGVLRRDRLVWSLTLAGYGAREIADVVDGHFTRADVDQARALLMAGHPRERVGAFLDARWRPHVLEPAVDDPVSLPGRRPLANPILDAHLVDLARLHGLDPALVRAVVAAESAGDPAARSPAGAIGLMQLMPATAAALGVDPWNPVENLRGGITYLAGLVRAYGNAALALIAYNAGPQHADRVRAGQAVPYRETRRYLDVIGERFPLPSY